jgi:hypothetical protein
MQCHADECISYLLIIESWTQQGTVNSENVLFFTKTTEIFSAGDVKVEYVLR